MEVLLKLSQIYLWLMAVFVLLAILDIGLGGRIFTFLFSIADSLKREKRKPDDWRIESGRVFPKKRP